jgi:phospholipid/cholesterol/gamma-HCH transport system permease protein
MEVTDQVDGLRCLAIDPISYLIVPRFMAMTISLVVLTLIGNAVALVSSSVMGNIMMDVDAHTFWSNLFYMLTPFDLLLSILKSTLFGVIIAASSCHFGLATSDGAPGVGKSVNKAVVLSAVAIFVSDYVLTFLIA